MKKIILIACCMLTACVNHSDLGKNVEGYTVKKITCHGGGWPNVFYSQASCLEKAKKVCPIKASASSSGHDSNGWFHEVLYICTDEYKENVQ